MRTYKGGLDRAVPDAGERVRGLGGMSEATPRPWSRLRCSGGYLVEGPHGASQRVVRGSGGVREEADAEMIVVAVNAFDDLVAALKGCITAMEEWGAEEDGIPDWSPSGPSAWRAYKAAEAALVKAFPRKEDRPCAPTSVLGI